MKVRLIIEHPGSHSCLGAVSRYILDNKIDIEQTDQFDWILFLINPLPSSTSICEEQNDLKDSGIGGTFTIVSEVGVARLGRLP